MLDLSNGTCMSAYIYFEVGILFASSDKSGQSYRFFLIVLSVCQEAVDCTYSSRCSLMVGRTLVYCWRSGNSRFIAKVFWIQEQINVVSVQCLFFQFIWFGTQARIRSLDNIFWICSRLPPNHSSICQSHNQRHIQVVSLCPSNLIITLAVFWPSRF